MLRRVNCSRVIALLGCLTALATRGSAQTYTFTTFAGTPGGSGIVDGTGASARFYSPSAVVADAAGNLYVADSVNHTLRRISPTGAVTTFAGLAGTYGNTNGAGSAARFAYPTSLALDAAGNLYVADTNNSLIRRVTPAGVVTTFSGTGDYRYVDGPAATAGFERPTGIAVDAAGNVYVSESNAHTIRKIAPNGTVSTLAGTNGTSGSADGAGASARFNNPGALATDRAGNLYVADTENHTIRKITPAGVVTTLAGAASQSGSADGTGASARFDYPTGLAIDATDTLYVAEFLGSTIRKLTPAGVVTTLAGAPRSYGSTDGAGSAARFRGPSGLAVIANGNVVVADSANHVIRQITPAGVVTTLAGTAPGGIDAVGTAARFNAPEALVVDAAGNVFVADTSNHAIRKITPAGAVTTLAGTAGSAGSADGSGAAARFRFPRGIAVDASGTVFVADSDNHTVRKITPAGVVTTLAGRAGNSGSADGAATLARFDTPVGIAVDAAGNVFVADYESHLIRKISTSGTVTTLAGLAGAHGKADGTGSAARFTFPQGLAIDAAGNVFVCERFNYAIRKITSAGLVTTISGLVGGRALALAADGSLFVADDYNSAIHRLGPQGGVTTVAGGWNEVGTADGTGRAARFNTPSGIALAPDGTLYVADTENQTIRKGVPAGETAIASRLINLSTRGALAAGGALTPGFVVRGGGAKALVVRAVGPQLASFGLAGLPDPKLELLAQGASVPLFANDDWGGTATLVSAFAGVGAFPLTTDTKSAALAATVNAEGSRGYSVRIESATAGATGVVLAEVYDRDGAGAASRLVNLSTLAFIGSGGDALTAGFVVAGAEPKWLLVRAVGPGLAAFGVASVLSDPEFTVLAQEGGRVVGGSFDWDSSPALTVAFGQAGAFGLTPGSKDAATLVRLAPGGYTVTVTGSDGATGNALLEIYDLDP